MNNVKNIKKTNETKLRIIESFFELYKNKPIEKITIQEVADKAGIHRATFYKYFSDTYAIVEYEEALIFRYFQLNILNILNQQPALVFRTKELQKLIVPFYEEYGDHLLLLLDETGDAAFRKQVKDTLEQAFYQAFRLEQPDITEQYLIRFMIAGIISTLCSWHKNRDIEFDELVSYMHSRISAVLAMSGLSQSGKV